MQTLKTIGQNSGATMGQENSSVDQLQFAPDEEGIWRSPVLIQYWQAIIRWRIQILAVIFTAIVIGVLATLFMSPRYEAKTLIEISREQKNIAKVEGVENKVGLNDVEFYETQYKLLEAESLAERVVRALRLEKNDDFFDAHGVDVSSIDEEAEARGEKIDARRKEVAVNLLLDTIDIRPIPRSRLTEIRYASRSASLSSSIANAWAKEFIGATMDRQYASSADARKFLEGRLEQLRERIDDSERNLVKYANANGIVTLDTVRDSEGKASNSRTLASTDLETLNAELTKAKAERIAAQSRLVRSGAETSSDALSSNVISGLREQRAKLDSEYAKLLAQFEPQYGPAMAVKQQRDALDSAIATELRRISSGRQLAYQEALDRERQLQAKVSALVGELTRQREAAIQQAIVQRDVDTNTQLYDALLQRYKEIGVAGSVGVSNISVVDAAKTPKVPTSPRMLINVLVGLLVGLGIASVMVFALEQVDEGIRNPDDVKFQLKAALIGNIPLAEVDPIVALEDSKSALSEAYFSARTTLAFATNHGLPKTLAITSTQPGEGKSTTSFSLAVVMAKTGRSVLLVDGDLRSPSLHGFAQLDNSKGLSNLLAGDVVADHVHREVYRNMSLLTTGPIPPSPAELLSSDRFAELLKMFSAEFDHVIVDLPPVLGLADTVLMGRAVEGVVYVVQAERTARRAIRSSLQRLRMGGVNVFGVIVSQIDYSKHSFGYGYGYGYGYGEAYGYGSGDQEGNFTRK